MMLEIFLGILVGVFGTLLFLSVTLMGTQVILNQRNSNLKQHIKNHKEDVK